ncbi:hypothetical protein [Streptomyces sp. NPDC050264]|uniref:hypothetical protein n=1 Tax=Streptomyces sp. NPDC050264 TaxID=3155038 RepID=UPI00343EC8D3
MTGTGFPIAADPGQTIATCTGPVAALGPALGHKTACARALEAHRTGRPALDLIRERELLTEAELRELTSPTSLTGPPSP